MKKFDNQVDKSRPMFDHDAEEKRYKRYKYVCYGQLVLKGLLFFALGLFVEFLFHGD